MGGSLLGTAVVVYLVASVDDFFVVCTVARECVARAIMEVVALYYIAVLCFRKGT